MRIPGLIKVCGLKEAANAAEVAALSPDFIGFIFYKSSPRYAGSSIASIGTWSLDPSIARVGVFVNESLEVIRTIARNCRLNYIQLHGGESPEYCASLHGEGLRIIKAFRIHPAFDFSVTNQYAPYSAFFVFDTHSENFGGSGKKFEWKLLGQYHGPVPFLLGGGIGPPDLEELLRFKHAFLAGYDLNSRFETSPGMKDVNALAQFIHAIRINV